MLSMTGFGDARGQIGKVEVGVELRTVNHRFLDLNCRLPASYQRFEHEIGRLVKERLRRGRVDLTLTRTFGASASIGVNFHEDVFRKYVQIAEEMLRVAKIRDPNALLSLLPGIAARREVFDTSSDLAAGGSGPDESWEDVRGIVDSALGRLIEMRSTEGDALARELERLLGEFDRCVSRLAGEAASLPETFRERLRVRLERLLPEGEVDPSRLAQEVAVLADRADVTEELARLASHVEQFRATMREAECGRKLEFLLQEMGREVNTTGSKAQSSAISAAVVEGKALLEKLREQVLNVE